MRIRVCFLPSNLSVNSTNLIYATLLVVTGFVTLLLCNAFLETPLLVSFRKAEILD